MGKISVIVPVYNVEKYVEYTIKSLLKQNYSDYEIILIDDGSTDHSYDICLKYSKKYPNILLYHQLNRGVSGARNRGLSIATGEYITFVDADDHVSASYLKDLSSEMKKNKADMSFQIYNTYFPDGTIEPSVDKPFDCIMTKNEFIEFEILGRRDTSVYAYLYKTKIIRENDIKFDEKISNLEDMLFLFEYAIHCDNIFYSSKNNYFRIARRDGCVFSNFNARKLSALSAYNKINEILIKENYNNDYIKKNMANKFITIMYFLTFLTDSQNKNLRLNLLQIAADLKDKSKHYISIKFKIKYFIIKYFIFSYKIFKTYKNQSKHFN